MKVLPSLVEAFLRQKEEKKKKSMYKMLKLEARFGSNSHCLKEGIPTDQASKSMLEANNFSVEKQNKTLESSIYE